MQLTQQTNTGNNHNDIACCIAPLQQYTSTNCVLCEILSYPGKCGRKWGKDNSCSGVRPCNSRAPTIAANHFEQRNRCASLDLRAFPLRHIHLACPRLGVAQADLWLDEDVDGGCFVPWLPVVPHHPPLRPPTPLPPWPLQGTSTAHATLLPGGLLLDVCHVVGGVGHVSPDGG